MNIIYSAQSSGINMFYNLSRNLDRELNVEGFQELIYSIKPDTIIETGVAHGGSLIFYAGLFKAMGIDGQIIGVDIEIRKHNRIAIEEHELFNQIKLIEGSSINLGIVEKVKETVIICEE